MLASLEVEAAVPWTVSETELAAFLDLGQPGVALDKARKEMLNLLDCVHCDVWIWFESCVCVS